MSLCGEGHHKEDLDMHNDLGDSGRVSESGKMRIVGRERASDKCFQSSTTNATNPMSRVLNVTR